jgi:hypothetical protein
VDRNAANAAAGAAASSGWKTPSLLKRSASSGRLMADRSSHRSSPRLLKRQRTTGSTPTTTTETIEDCESLAFLFRDYDDTNTAAASDDEEIITTTLVGRVSHYFDHLIIKGGNNKSNEDDANQDDIDVRRLLIACGHYAEAMDQIGQRQSARDMRQNIRKVELYGAIDHHQHSSMRQLLRQELETKPTLHDYVDDEEHHHHRRRLVKLNEHSSAIGLLWIRRSLEFQYELFHQLVRYNNDAAITVAYDRTLRQYHGWALQKVYAVALAATAGNNLATTAQLGGFDANGNGKNNGSAIMTPRQYDATRRDLQHLMDQWRPLLQIWNEIFDELNLQDLRRV